MNDQIPKIFTVQEVAEMCKVSIPLVRKWIYQRRLLPVRLGRRVLFTEDEIRRLINESQERE